jgi:hypothetical protein
MNGRVYDPLIGRFMSADPYIQAPDDLQSHNRYAYVMNNPLNLDDPSGYWSISKAWKKIWKSPIFKAIVGIAVAVYAPALLKAWMPSLFGTSALATSVATGALSGFASTGTLKGALTGAFTAGIMFGVGEIGQHFKFASGGIEKIALHAGAGCLSSVAGGGSCKSGAISGALGEFGHNIPTNGMALGTVKAAMLGGIGAKISGGKFADGATTGAFGYLFNYCMHEGCTPTESGNMRDHDAYGKGGFGESRDGGARLHEGMDYVTAPGEEIQAPIGGIVKRQLSPYAGDSRLTGVEIVNEAGQSAKIFYMKPLNVAIGMRVNAGEVIGHAQDLHLKYKPTMTNHVHVESRVNGVVKNPHEFMRGSGK